MGYYTYQMKTWGQGRNKVKSMALDHKSFDESRIKDRCEQYALMDDLNIAKYNSMTKTWGVLYSKKYHDTLEVWKNLKGYLK